MKMCAACGVREATKASPNGRRGKYCSLCRANDKHYHRGRRLKVADMLVGVDCESAQFDVDGEQVNRIITFSYQRADGTRNSILAEPGGYIDPPKVWRWLVEELSGHYFDATGREWRQHLFGFHFNHDVGMMLYPLWDNLMLIHKATAKERGLLCGTTHKETDDVCLKYHRFDPEDCRRVLRDGGEEDYLAWDEKSQMGFSTSAGRRFYMEHRPFGDRMEKNRRIDIHDVGTLFPGTFEKVIDLWQPDISEEDRQIIAWGKKQRQGAFKDEDRAKVAKYSEAECGSLARLLDKFLRMLKETIGVEMKPEKLFGSGSVAAEVMGFHHVPKRMETVVETRPVSGVAVDDIGQLTYFGGKIEGPVIGLLSEPAYPRDINSAYPSKAVKQVCMREGHGEWLDHPGHRDLADGATGYALVSWNFSTISTAFPPFMVRNRHASVFSPQVGTRGWVTLPEYQAAVAYWGRQNITTHHMVWWQQSCTCSEPLGFLSEVYDRRYVEKARAKDEALSLTERLVAKAREEILKLIINSAYGKLAQRRPTWGKYTNIHWAAMITGATRAQLNVEAWTGEALGGTPVYAHTDSMTFVGLEREDEGKALGAWGKEDPKEGLLIVQSGIAVSTVSGKSATRGVRTSTFVPYVKEWAAARTSMFADHPSTWLDMRPEETRMTTLRQAHHLKKPWLAGSFRTDTRKVGFRTAKREFDQATPLGPANPYAWRVPPRYMVLPENVAQLEDLDSYQALLRQQVKEGLWDNDRL